MDSTEIVKTGAQSIPAHLMRRVAAARGGIVALARKIALKVSGTPAYSRAADLAGQAWAEGGIWAGRGLVLAKTIHGAIDFRIKAITESETYRRTTSTHIFFALCSGSLLVIVIWSTVSTLDIVSMTRGEVIPSSQIKTIQHLEGGIVLDILAKEGQIVAKDQPLLVLDQVTSGADVAELGARLKSLRVDVIRLETESSNSDDLKFPEKIGEEAPDIVRQARERFEVRRRAQATRVVSQKEVMQQKEHEIREITSRIANLEENLKLHNEQIKISEELLKEDLTNRYVHLDLLKRAVELQGRITESAAALDGARAGLKDAMAKLETIQASYLDEVRKELDTVRLSHNELSQRFQKFEDNLRRTTIRSPVDGVVKTLYVTTVGGVIKGGDKVMDIVPGEDRLVIEAKLPTQDIGHVRPGQAAVIKLPSADAARFGNLNGEVVNISPDTLLTRDGMPFYKVRIETDKSYFEKGKMRYQLFPGMQVMANIQTGTRTVAQYILDPLLHNMGEAMQER